MPLYMRYPNGLSKALTLSYDDGVETDAHLIDIMKENGILGTFNLNSGKFAPEGTVYPSGTVVRRMTQSQIITAYSQTGMEVAVHGKDHTYLDKDPSSTCVYQIMKDREALEKLFGVLVRGMAYPFGTYNDKVIRIAKDCGIIYARTIQSTESFSLPEDFMRFNPTCHHNNPDLMGLLSKFINRKNDSIRHPMLFYLWGHSYEFDRDDNWNVIEKFCNEAGRKSDVWYATNIQIVEYCKAFQQLIYSADGNTLYNPTCTTLWMKSSDGKNLTCAPNETVFLGTK